MKTMISRIAAALLIALLATGLLVFALAESDNSEPVSAPETEIATIDTQETPAAESADATSSKAMAAAIAIGAAGAAGAIAMGIAIAKSSEGISRQPEAAEKIRTSLMLGLVFIETAIIYALIVAILIIFVL